MSRKPHLYHFIYRTVNQINGKYYIGMHSTSCLEDEYIGSGQMLWHSIKKYGRENFKKEILEFFPDRKSLGLREKEIVTKEIVSDPLCMNLKLGGEYSPGTYGKKYSEESREKMSAWKRSDEFREKISKARTGTHLDLETRQKMSKSAKERKINGTNKGMKGKKQSTEAIEKNRANHLGKKHSEESRKKMSESQTGKKHTKETKEKIRNSHLGIKQKPFSEETRRKMSEARKKIFGEKEMCIIIEAVMKHDGEKKLAAKELGISESSLYKKLKIIELCKN